MLDSTDLTHHQITCMRITKAPAPCSPKVAAGSNFNFWGVANAVAETVKRGTVEIASTVRETDWRAEIQAFGRDVLEETEELGQTAVVAVEHAVEHVEQLPQHVRTQTPTCATLA